jgi:hypothetical protein
MPSDGSASSTFTERNGLHSFNWKQVSWILFNSLIANIKFWREIPTKCVTSDKIFIRDEFVCWEWFFEESDHRVEHSPLVLSINGLYFPLCHLQYIFEHKLSLISMILQPLKPSKVTTTAVVHTIGQIRTKEDNNCSQHRYLSLYLIGNGMSLLSNHLFAGFNIQRKILASHRLAGWTLRNLFHRTISSYH